MHTQIAKGKHKARYFSIFPLTLVFMFHDLLIRLFNTLIDKTASTEKPKQSK